MDASPSPALEPRKRKQGPRSRTGCGTCKGRKKKCDEQFENESCARCREAGLACIAESQRPSRRIKASNTPPPSHASSFPLALAAPIASASASRPPASTTTPPPARLSLPPHAATTTIGPSIPDNHIGPDWLVGALGDSGGFPPTGGGGGAEDAGWEELVAHFHNPQAFTHPSDTMAEIREFSTQWWEFYNSLNESYFFSIPKEVRQLVKRQMKDIVASSDLGRAALSTWCAAHFSVVLAKENDEQHLEWANKADRYYQEALVLVHDRSYPLEVRIGAVLDMRLANIHQHGAAHANSILAVGESFVVEELGPRPSINLSALWGSATLALRELVYASVFHTITFRNRLTVFDLSAAPVLEPPSVSPEPVTSDALRVRLGLPVELLLCLAAIANLAAQKPAMDVSQFREESDAIEVAIKRWRSEPVGGEVIDSAAYISDLATFEIWRQTALIYLHQALHGLGSHSKVLQAALAQIIQLSNSLVPPSASAPSVFHNAARSCCWFLASTVAVHANDRDICREGLNACGIGKVYQDNLQVIERLWAETASSGVAPDWREMIERAGLAVAFM